MTQQHGRIIVSIPKNQYGRRLDQALAEILPDYSRSCIKKWILNQRVLVNDKVWNSPKNKVFGGEVIAIRVEIEKELIFKAQDIPLNIVYEDKNILVINKPRDLVVHPGINNSEGTLLNALLYYYPPIINIPRAGIVHRLDKNTTGLMVVAKTISAQIWLIRSLQLHKITREYEAIVIGKMIAGGKIDKPIGRHKTRRTHMSVHLTGKHAVTHYRIIERFRIHTRLRIRLETGRTHQIRVHMAHINYPLVGDYIHGGFPRLPKEASEAFLATLRKFDRPALHAAMLRLYHPITNTEMEWHAPLPQDMSNLIKIMRADFKEYKVYM